MAVFLESRPELQSAKRKAFLYETLIEFALNPKEHTTAAAGHCMATLMDKLVAAVHVRCL